VSKADLRVEAYGTVDELSAHLALLADMMCEPHGRSGCTEEPHGQLTAPSNHVKKSDARRLASIAAQIDEIQIDLMTVEAMLATGRTKAGTTGAANRVTPLPFAAIERLERQIDEMSEGLPPLKGFTIPGGHAIVSQSHVCRTVCRRAERAAVRAAAEYTDHSERESAVAFSSTPPMLPPPAAAEASPAAYLNRLSDWLYVAGRRAVEILDIKERYWMPEKF
jgi:cob(I)alamin adenosyltransferase